MAYNVSNQEFKSNKKSKFADQPSRLNKVSTTDLDINEDIKPIADEAIGMSQRLINEVRSQGEAVLGQVRTLAKDYGLEVSALRGQVAQAIKNNPGAVVLGAACVGFCAGYLAKGLMSKSPDRS